MADSAPVYLDFAATTPVDPQVADVVTTYLVDEFGNAGSRTHGFGTRARKAVEAARRYVASVVDADPAEVIFTSGATEANNLALLGLEEHGRSTGRMHIVSTAIEHKAVLEPLEVLAGRSFTVDLIPPSESGRVDAGRVLDAVRDDTLAVSVMHVNNETGVRQPIEEIAAELDSVEAYMHVDAAQGFGKDLGPLRQPRIDLISMSGHKVFGPKGVGALITRRRQRTRPPLTALLHGGGQERGLRPGTLPVHLIAGLGEAAALAAKHAEARQEACERIRQRMLEVVDQLGGEINGDAAHAVPHILNASFPGIDSEAAILALRDVVAISNGSACTSESYEPSHVLAAMGLPDERVRGAVRFSWGPDTKLPEPSQLIDGLAALM